MSYEIDSDAIALFDVPNLTGTPERRLLLALLERAILDFVGNDEREVEDAERWIFEDLDNTLPYDQFSFGWVCQQLDLQVAKTAETIRNMPKRGDRKIAPWYFNKAS